MLHQICSGIWTGRLSNLVAEIPYPSLSVVCLGYRKEKIKTSVDAFGFLIPSREKRKILGTLYDSSIFPNRAPEGYVLLRSMVGGARYSDLARENEAKLVDLVKGELAEIMDIRSAPDFVRVYRHEMAIPQYTVGHLARLNEYRCDASETQEPLSDRQCVQGDRGE